MSLVLCLNVAAVMLVILWLTIGVLREHARLTEIAQRKGGEQRTLLQRLDPTMIGAVVIILAITLGFIDGFIFVVARQAYSIRVFY